MKVRALVSFAGPSFACNAGDEFDLPPGKERWLAIGFVERVDDAPGTAAPETTTLEPPERAVMPRPRKKTGKKS